MTVMAGIARDVNATDEVLVGAVRRRDDRAFEQLYERYQRRIAAYVYGMVNDYGRAEDITQEVFVSALRRIRATERPIAFKPWIYEIARNACIDQFRRTRRTEEISFDAEDGAGAIEAARVAGGATPDAAIDAKQQLDDLCGAFGGLSQAHHEILVMRELEGLSYREIGERLGLSRPSVESTLFRARRRLSEEYQELVSGERCRRVSAMLASGFESLGTRDERRLARHVAHCQPCRRQAYAAGVDTATLTRYRVRKAAARVAAFLPLPAFMRFRRLGGSPAVAQWSGTAASLGDSAGGWTKALAAAAVLVAGGAGVAGHHSPAPAVSHPSAPASVTAPVVHRAAHHARAVVRHHHAAAAHTVSKPAVARPHRAAPVKQPSVAPAVAHAATPPAAGSVKPTPSHAPVPPLGGSRPGTPTPRTPATPAVNIPGVNQIENAVTEVNGDVGAAVSQVLTVAGGG
jgi:RNA polymerase sigma factor (sigma-70 family)